MADPLVSVVIPLYNAEEWIGETIRSVQKQTVEPDNLDLIIVDNGSTDRSVECARTTLQEAPLEYRIVVMGENRGPGAARNAGWLSSRAPWIQFLDSDDLLVPDKISFQLTAAQASPADVASIYSEWQSYAHDGAEWKLTPPLRSPEIAADPVLNHLEDKNFVHTGSQLFRTSWLRKVQGFDERWWLIEDVDLNMRLAMAGAGLLPSMPAALSFTIGGAVLRFHGAADWSSSRDACGTCGSRRTTGRKKALSRRSV